MSKCAKCNEPIRHYHESLKNKSGHEFHEECYAKQHQNPIPVPQKKVIDSMKYVYKFLYENF